MPTTQPIARASGIIVLTLTIAYLLLGLLPFYANGIHLHSYQEIAGSLVDVKGFAPFNWTWLGRLAQGVAMLTTGYTPLISLVLSPLLLVISLRLARRSFHAREAWWWVFIAASNLATVALTWQIQSTVMVWLVD